MTCKPLRVRGITVRFRSHRIPNPELYLGNRHRIGEDPAFAVLMLNWFNADGDRCLNPRCLIRTSCIPDEIHCEIRFVWTEVSAMGAIQRFAGVVRRLPARGIVEEP